MSNRQVSTLGIVNSEPSIAVNLLNPQNIIVAFINSSNGSDSRIVVSLSQDGGISFTSTVLPYPSGYNGAGDPIVDYIYPNTFLVVSHVFNTSASFDAKDESIAVYRSVNGGSSFSAPILVNQGYGINVTDDKPFLVTDKSGGSPYLGNTYIAYTRQLNNSPVLWQVHFHRSNDNGQTWSYPVKLTKPHSSSNYSSLTIGPVGEIYAGWIQEDSNNNPQGFRVVKSIDGGQTFSTEVLVSNVIFYPHLPTADPVIPPFQFRALTVSFLAADISTSLYSGNVYAVWQDTRFGSSNILLSISIDRAVTWSSPTKVDNGSTGSQNFFPFISVSSDTGDIQIVYYSNRNNSNLLDVYAAVSTNGGGTFNNSRVTNLSFDPNNPVSTFIGDYLGNAIIPPSQNVAVWTDTRNGRQDIFIGP
ncbi:hypothetical protein BC351_14765 [Paenibacillus ferrarius]|uniref:Sialidase domain-containing protein n=1 Tax=Paenibacillus ferrarius TaxID=1469647 RepID=A0A1V4HSI5_9BACL|nr:sialidase family protein [Paenibacillus ferrarius]OPH61207.1 hypothetical protein BC351_14765 [Paenibacillus ferrarius]